MLIRSSNVFATVGLVTLLSGCGSGKIIVYDPMKKGAK